MKSPAFQWYAADYLADERVMLLSLESEAAYVRLLNYCWREGSIPSNPALCAPMCKYADVKVIKPALALFTKSPTQAGRLIHKRLEEERGKQEAFRLKQAENGRNGGRPRKPTENPNETQTKGLGSFGETQTKAKKSSSSSTSSSIPSNDGSASEPPSAKPELSPELQARLAVLPDTSGEIPAEESLLAKPDYFKRVCDELGLGDIDHEHYRRAGLLAAKGEAHRTVKQWESWVSKFFTNQKSAARKMGGHLLEANADAQPKGKGANEITFEMNPTAVARRRREAEEMEHSLIAANLERINRNEGTHFTIGGMAAQPQG